MRYTLIYILLIFSLLFEVQTQDCETVHYQVPETPGNNECSAPLRAENNTYECTYLCNDKPNVINTVDNVKGILTTRFPLPPIHCAHNLYKVFLMVNEQVREESNCNENVTFTDKHSIREYQINRCKENESCGGENCTEYGEVVFNYIFSSCYKLRIEVFIDTHSRPALHSCPFFITTNFTKLKIADIQPATVVNYNQKESLNEVIIAPKSTFENMIITLFGDLKELEDDSCDRDGIAQSCCLVDRNVSLCRPSKGVTAPTCNFAKDSLFETIQCNFYNVSPGNYCVRIKLTDDRCVLGTIWTANSTGCRWSHSFVTEYHPVGKPVISMPIDSTLTAFLILLGIAVGGLLILLLFWRSVPTSTSWSHAESCEEVGRPMIEGLKVLLLYPRDCQDFMSTMESFRKLLETYNIEVYDCHASDEVLNGPLYWLQKVMGYPKLCTVIVSSHCAYLQQQAIQMGCNITSDSVYKDPIFIDSIFMYGLKLIMEDVSVDTYLKNFVIGFNDFSSDDKMLTLPTTFRRYCIPEHFPKLLVDMNLELNLENIQICSSNEYIELQNNVKNMINYKAMKPQYLEEILNLV